MIYAEKGNRVKRINEADIQAYVDEGYTITDGQGTVLRETVPTDIATLRLAFTKKSEEINALKAEIERLKAENKALAERATAPTAQPTVTRRGRKKDSETEE